MGAYFLRGRNLPGYRKMNPDATKYVMVVRDILCGALAATVKKVN